MDKNSVDKISASYSKSWFNPYLRNLGFITDRGSLSTSEIRGCDFVQGFLSNFLCVFGYLTLAAPKMAFGITDIESCFFFHARQLLSRTPYTRCGNNVHILAASLFHSPQKFQGRQRIGHHFLLAASICRLTGWGILHSSFRCGSWSLLGL